MALLGRHDEMHVATCFPSRRSFAPPHPVGEYKVSLGYHTPSYQNAPANSKGGGGRFIDEHTQMALPCAIRQPTRAAGSSLRDATTASIAQWHAVTK